MIQTSDGDYWTLAVSDIESIINEHWDYLNQNLIPLSSQIEDEDEQLQFLINKVTSLASVQEGEEGKSELKVQQFRKEFKELSNEKFVTCTSFFLTSGLDFC